MSLDNNNNAIAWRNGYKWTINECLRLEREYDLLKLTVPEMAVLHNRTNNAIICKLHSEGLADYSQLYIQTYGNDSIMNDLTDLTQHHLQQFHADYGDSGEDVDDEYVPKLDTQDYESSDDNNNNDYESHGYLAHQVKTLQKQIEKILGFLISMKKTDTTNTGSAGANIFNI